MSDSTTLLKVIDNSLDLYIAFNKLGKISYMNKAAMNELGVSDFSDLPVDINFFMNADSRISTNNDTAIVFDGAIHESMIYRKNMTCFPASVRSVVIDNDDDLHYMVILRNRSAEIALEKKCETIEEEAVAAAKTKDEFVANVTHELRTPVNGILGNTRILLENENDTEKLNTLHTIEHSCNVMHELINNILDFSKLEAGKFTLENREFEFSKMIDFIKSNHQSKLNEKGLNFVVNISKDIPNKIIGDELRIGQVLNNLLSNACKFTSVGSVTLQALKTDQKDNRIELFFMVIDTGIGLEKSDYDKLFKSFSQVDASITRQYGGTGLGLNISKQLVEMMGGSINVNSEKGRGTMFSFSIWVDVPEDEAVSGGVNDIKPGEAEMLELLQNNYASETRTFGSEENLKELRKLMEKLVLCIEMKNWAKAEGFAETIKQMTADAPKEIKTSCLRLKMAVQKADYDKSIEAFNASKGVMEL